MGNICSKKAKDASEKTPPAILSELGLNFSLDDWKKYHNDSTIEQNQSELENIGADLKKLQSFPKCLIRAAFICCNTYTKPEYSLGPGPMIDAIEVAKYMKEIGFSIYFIHDPKSIEFMKYFQNFIQKTTEYLFIYFIGHSASADDKKSDDSNEKEESFIFDDDYLFDDKLLDVIISSKNSETCKIIFLSDCCHSSSVYNFQTSISRGKKIPPNLISFSAIRKSKTAKPTSVGGTDQGILTFYFYKLLSQDGALSPCNMQSQIGQYLDRFQQNFVIYTTTESLLNEPIFK